MLEVVRADRVRQVLDVRDDLLATYLQGGRPSLAQMIVRQQGSAADPTVFIALTGGRSRCSAIWPKHPRSTLHRARVR